MATTTFWTGNAINIQAVDTISITGVANGGTLSAIINQKSVTYTCTATDTTATATAALLALISNTATAPPEFGELTFASPTTTTITATETNLNVKSLNQTGGLTVAGAGGAALSLAHTVTGSYASDVGNAANWLRAGVQSLPQNTDDVEVANSAVGLLWNLAALAAVQFGSFTRFQSFTATVGLPENNSAGYFEFRNTYFKFVGPAGTLPILLGTGQTGGGPTRERYDVGAQRSAVTVLAAGSPQDDYAVRFLGTNVNNTLSIVGTSVGVAMLPGETADLASATLDSGGSVAIGPGVAFTGALTLTGASAVVNCAPGSIIAQNGSTVTVSVVGGNGGLTYATVTAKGGSTLTWLADGTITTLTLQTGSTLDKSTDLRALTITNSTLDADSCQVLDSNNVVTFTNATTLNNTVTSGPFILGTGRTIKVT